MKTLIVVDMQADFLDGSLPVPNTNLLANHISLASVGYDLVIATRDWHPGNHCSFADFGGEWPRHCVKGSPGARLHPLIDTIADIIISKGTNPDEEAFSGFAGTVLDEILMSRQITGQSAPQVDVCGVALDKCVAATVFDANAMGFKTRLLSNLSRGIDEEECVAVMSIMKQAGVEIV